MVCSVSMWCWLTDISYKFILKNELTIKSLCDSHACIVSNVNGDFEGFIFSGHFLHGEFSCCSYHGTQKEISRLSNLSILHNLLHYITLASVPSTLSSSQFGDFLPLPKTKVKGMEKGLLSPSMALMMIGSGFCTQMKALVSVSLGTLSFTSSSVTDTIISEDFSGFSSERK